tara:strand:+ start:742 stop:1290 length:549 start_codon:yes stop_codon:yes gene_type:complete
MAKKLLNESERNRFKTLANIKTLNENFGGMYEEEEMDNEQEVDVGDVGLEDEAPEAPEAPEVDMEDAGMGEAEELELTDDEALAIIELGKKLEMAMPSESEELGADEEQEEMPPEENPFGPEDEEEIAAGEEELMEALRGISYKPSKTEMVNEVAKRVAKRLHEAKKLEKKMNKVLGKKKNR